MQATKLSCRVTPIEAQDTAPIGRKARSLQLTGTSRSDPAQAAQREQKISLPMPALELASSKHRQLRSLIDSAAAAIGLHQASSLPDDSQNGSQHRHSR